MEQAPKVSFAIEILSVSSFARKGFSTNKCNAIFSADLYPKPGRDFRL
jgi:hypothetical protein